jgi:hypothetical protein
MLRSLLLVMFGALLFQASACFLALGIIHHAPEFCWGAGAFLLAGIGVFVTVARIKSS